MFFLKKKKKKKKKRAWRRETRDLCAEMMRSNSGRELTIFLTV